MGAAGGAALGGVVKGIGNFANRLRGESGLADLAKTVAQDPSAEVPIYNTDIAEPETVWGKILRKGSDDVPYFGTGGMRAEQQKARTHLSEELRDRFAKSGYSADTLVESILDKSKFIRSKANEHYGQIVESMKDVPISSQKTLEAIERHIQKLTRTPNGQLKQDVDNKTVNMLRAVSNDIKADPSFLNLQSIRRNFREGVRGDRTVWPDSHQMMANQVYNVMGRDLKRGVLGNLGRKELRKWSTANEGLALESVKVKRSALKKVFKDGDINPTTAERLLNSNNKYEQKALYDALDDKGKGVAMSGIINGLVEKATNINGEINPDGLGKALKLHETAINQFATEKDRRYLNGVAKILNKTRHAQKAAVSYETGAKVVTVGTIIGALAHPLLALAPVAGGLFGKLYESPSTRNLIIKMGEDGISNSAFENLLKKLAARSGLANEIRGGKQ